MKTLMFLPLLVISSLAFSQERLADVFTYQGRAFQSDGVTALTGTAAFTVQVRSANGNCLLFQESHTGVDLSASNGFFALNIGDGTSKTGLSLSQAFSNLSQAKTTLSGTCGGTYTPTNQDARVLRITVDTGTPVQLDDQYVYSVPKALVADTLNGYTYSQFVQSLTTTQRNALTSMVSGTTIYNTTTGRFNRYNGATWGEAFGATNVGAGAGVYKGKTAGNDWFEFKTIVGATGVTATSNANDVTVAIDPTYTQRRVTGTCAAGNYITAIAQNGTVTCAADAAGVASLASDGTTISGDGTTGSEFAVIPGGIDIADLANELDFAQLPAGCNDDEILKMNGASWNCEADASASGGLTTVATDNATIDGDGDATPLFLMNDAVTSAKIDDGTIATIDIADDAVTNAKLADGAIDAVAKIATGLCTANQILKKKSDNSVWECAADTVGINGVIVDANATLAGDGTLGNELTIAPAGVTTTELADDAVTNAKLADGAIDAVAKVAAGLCAANQVLKKKSDNSAWECAADSTGTALPAMTDAQIVVSNGTTPAAVAMSGDIAISNTGATTIQTGVVETAMLDDGAVTFAKLDLHASCGAGEVLTVNSGGTAWECAAPAGGAVDEIADADADTKIQVEEAADEDKIRFDTAGSERMIIDASGNVGIGTTNPTSKLYVYNSAADTSVVVRSAAGSSTAMQFTNQGGMSPPISLSIGVDNSSGNGLITNDGIAEAVVINSKFTAPILFGVNDTARMTIANGGNIGIGTTAPDEKLHVVGKIKMVDGNQANGYVLTSDANGVGTWQAASGGGGLTTVATDNATIDGDGDATPLFLMDDAVTSAKIDDGTIATIDIADDAVTNAKLADGAIDAVAKIATGLCTANQILKKKSDNSAWECATDGGGINGVLVDANATLSGDGTLGSELTVATNGIDTLQLADGAVTFAKLDLHASCGAGEVLTVNSGGTAWECAAPASGAVDEMADADADTKIQVEEAADEDKIRFDTAGSERMIIDETGNIGIGISSPTALLHLKKTTGAGTELVLEDTVSTLKLKRAGGISEMLHNDNRFIVIGGTAIPGFDRGINVGSYSQSSAAWLMVENTSAGQKGAIVKGAAAQTANLMEFQDSAGTALTAVNASGNIGIGTSSPDEKLHVVGKIKMVDGNQANGYVLTSDANGVGTWQAAGGGGGGLTTVATDNTTIDGDGDATPLFLMNDAVTSAKIDDGTIATIDIADDAVTNAKLADGAIDAVAKIATGLCTTSQILKKKSDNSAWECTSDTGINGVIVDANATLSGDGTLGSELTVATNGIDTLQLADGAVTFAKLDIHASCSAGEVLTVNSGATAWECVSKSVPTGTTTGHTLVWNNTSTAWESTSVLTVDETNDRVAINGRIVGTTGSDTDVTVSFSVANMVRTTASGACGSLVVSGTASGGSFTLTMPSVTATCTLPATIDSLTVKSPSGYAAGDTVTGVVYTFINDGSNVWVSFVPF